MANRESTVEVQLTFHIYRHTRTETRFFPESMSILDVEKIKVKSWGEKVECSGVRYHGLLVDEHTTMGELLALDNSGPIVLDLYSFRDG